MFTFTNLRNHAGFICILPLMIAVSATHHAWGEEKKPNVIFMIVDDLNDLSMAPIGKPKIATPNIDRLARRGVAFRNAHTNDWMYENHITATRNP